MNTKLAFDMKVYNIFCKYYFFHTSIVWPNFEHAPAKKLFLINKKKAKNHRHHFFIKSSTIHTFQIDHLYCWEKMIYPQTMENWSSHEEILSTNAQRQEAWVF